MKQNKRQGSTPPVDTGPPAPPDGTTQPARPADNGPGEVHFGTGSQSALEKLRRLEKQRAKSRASGERPLC